jgi:hypothetical protein
MVDHNQPLQQSGLDGEGWFKLAMTKTPYDFDNKITAYGDCWIQISGKAGETGLI